MAFNLFVSYGAAARDTATLRASGYLFVPGAMMQAIGGTDSKHVVLMYDTEHCLLALRLPKDDDPKAAQREVAVEKSGVAVNIVPLLKTFRLVKPKKKLKLPVKVEDGMLIVEMAQASDLVQ